MKKSNSQPQNKIEIQSLVKANGDFYHDLDEYNEKVALTHLKIAGEIAMWNDTRRFLEQQFRRNKCRNNHNNRIVPIEKRTKLYYKNYLFTDKKYLTTWDVFPSVFRSLLEEVLLKELTMNNFQYANKNYNYTDIYYNIDDKPVEIRFNKFNKSDWVLSEGSEINKDDIEILIKYRDGLIGFLDKCSHLINRYSLDSKRKCQKEIVRLTKIMNRNQ